MHKAKQIIEILEGFKLGDLGAGRSKLASLKSEDPAQPQPVAIKPQDELRRNPASSVAKLTWIKENKYNTDHYFGAIKWVEPSNGFQFVAYCHKRGPEQNDKYEVRVSGGPNLTVSYSLKFITVKDGHFIALYPFDEKDQKVVKRVLENVAFQLGRSGSFGYALATGALEKGWQIVGKEFLSYIRETAGVEKSPSFRML